MNLHEVNRGIHKRTKRTRIGRGTGSGLGKTSGRGHKGQGSLRGWSAHPAFEGGRLPLVRRIPKRGFNNRWARTVFAINVGQLDELFDAGTEVTVEALRAMHAVPSRFDFLKVLGDGQLTKKLRIQAHKFSATALEKIQQSGGEAVVLPGPAPVVKNQKRAKPKK